MEKVLHYSVDFETFDLEFSIYPDNNMDNIQKLFEKVMKQQIKNYHFDLVRNIYTTNDMKEIYGIDIDNDDWDEMVKSVWYQDKPSYKAIKVNKLSSCEGCRIGALGQRDHMDIGGCLAM